MWSRIGEIILECQYINRFEADFNDYSGYARWRWQTGKMKRSKRSMLTGSGLWDLGFFFYQPLEVFGAGGSVVRIHVLLHGLLGRIHIVQ